MILEVKVPSPGESITEVQLANWLVADGTYVEKDAELAEIDSDKATLSVSAESSGTIQILVEEGETIAVGTVIATLDTGAAKVIKKETAVQEQSPKVISESTEPVTVPPQIELVTRTAGFPGETMITPLARKLMKEKDLSDEEVSGYFRIMRRDVEEVAENRQKSPGIISHGTAPGSRESEHKKMSTLRMKLSQRLVAVKNETAMLTTFNEVNMSAILGIKKQYNESFKEKFGVGIGFMSFFTKAVTVALQQFPQVNSMIEGDEFITYKYADVGIAVSAPKGLVVPVIRNAESLSVPELEIKIKELAGRARDNKITLEEMTGGTFTITNGGVFGSLLSTPILNPPQSAILGMHNIVERPIALNGQVVIAPMMYVALSYDHRVIDGKDSVSFLVKVKELLENPVKMLFDGAEPNKVLLGL
jgi:2-oxoglutarate dehydrogenase E2 component (dihydrolipoamide succinyltransferase)